MGEGDKKDMPGATPLAAVVASAKAVDNASICSSLSSKLSESHAVETGLTSADC